MARHLRERDIENILSILDGWDGKLSWDKLCDQALKILRNRPTRQTLSKYTKINNAFKNKKEQIKLGVSNTKQPQSLVVAAQRIKRLEDENSRLKYENERLLEQFVVWQYNAFRHGLTEDHLSESLPTIDR